MGTGAFLGLIKKSKGDKRKGDAPEKGPPRDDEAGEEYSKVGDVTGDDDYKNDEAGEDGRLSDSENDDGGDAGDDQMERQAAFESFADAVGIPSEKRKRAHAALHSYFKACSRGSKSEE